MQANRKKTEILTVSIPKDLKQYVLKYAKKNDVTVSQITKEALRSALLKREWKQMQEEFRPLALKLGIKSDQDVEKYFG